MTTEEKYRVRKEMAQELQDKWDKNQSEWNQLFDFKIRLQSVIDAYDVNFRFKIDKRTV